MRAVLRSPRFRLGEGGVAGKGTIFEGVGGAQKYVADPTVCYSQFGLIQEERFLNRAGAQVRAKCNAS